tara:strand:+ start:545 stop:694 length:150 start_codon:yes stop_codon:yes gene_type:complete
MILILDMIMHNTLNLSLYHLIGIIEYFVTIDLISVIDTVGTMYGIIVHI